MMEITGKQYELVEITATVYEVGARVYLCGYQDFATLDHAMIILPEAERVSSYHDAGFDTSPDYQDWYGDLDKEQQSFISKTPMIGLDFRHISEGVSPDYADHISGFDMTIGEIGIDGAYGAYVPNILSEVNKDIDRMIDRLPMKNMWKETSLKHVFRFVIAFEHVYLKYYVWDSWAYEYDTEINWIGRVSIHNICKQLEVATQE